MTRRATDLLTPTPAGWIDVALSDFDAFLLDHANCERKASALAMSLVVKYPDRGKILPGLIAIAQEELEHFRQVHELVAKRGLTLQRDEPDPYVNQLLAAARHGRDERFIDRMLISSLVECRGAERFGLIAEAMDDPELRVFYERLWKSETKHGNEFVRLLMLELPTTDVQPRLEELARIEAEIIRDLAFRPALH